MGQPKLVTIGFDYVPGQGWEAFDEDRSILINGQSYPDAAGAAEAVAQYLRQWEDRRTLVCVDAVVMTMAHAPGCTIPEEFPVRGACRSCRVEVTIVDTIHEVAPAAQEED